MKLPELEDVCFFAGGALASAGVWRIYDPAGMIVAGFFLIVVSISIARGRRPNG